MCVWVLNSVLRLCTGSALQCTDSGETPRVPYPSQCSGHSGNKANFIRPLQSHIPQILSTWQPHSTCSKAETQGEGIGGRGGEQGKRARLNEKRRDLAVSPKTHGLHPNKASDHINYWQWFRSPIALRICFVHGAQVTDLVYFWSRITWCILIIMHSIIIICMN